MNRKERTILVTVGANLFLVAFKFGLARLSGSLALRASAWHSLADVFVALFVLAGLLVARWEEGRRKSAGLAENVVALVVSLLIFYVGYDIFREVLGGEVQELRNLGPVTVAALLTIAVSYFMARYKVYVGQQTGSPALIAGGYHSRMDMYSSAVVVAGLGGSALGLGNLDRVAAVVVVLFVVFSGYEIASGALRALARGGVLEPEMGWEEVGRHTGRFLRLAAGIGLALYLLSGFYTVGADERGVVRRFGQVVAQTEPGLHYRLPWPVERVDRVAVANVRRAETPRALMLTGDENLINVRLGVHYVVTDAGAYLFNVSEPDALVDQVAEAAVRQVVAERGVDDVLTTDKAQVQRRAAELAQTTLDGYQAGLLVVDVQLLESNPPQEVASAFRDVASAREDKNTYINEAYAYQNEIVPMARGQAEKIVRQAEARLTERVNVAAGEAQRFQLKAAEYRKAPAVTRVRLYLETMERVLPAARKYLLDPRVQTGTTDLWFLGQGAEGLMGTIVEGGRGQ